MTMIEHAPVLMIISPLAGALVLAVLSKFKLHERTRDIIAFISLFIPVLLLFYFSPQALKEPIIYEMGGWEHPYGISLVVDSLSITMALLVGIITTACFVYSLEVKQLLPKGDHYYILFLFMTTGLYGVFLTGDLINRFVFFEITLLTTYVLLTYTGTKESLRASFSYLILGSVASFFFLIGIGLLYFYTGYLDFIALSQVVPDLPASTRNIIFLFFIVSIGIKGGLIPFHTWLPDAHVNSPTPMTAVLAGLTVKTGAYILIKMFYLGFNTPVMCNLLIGLGLLSGLVGAVMAYNYFDLKKILAWLTISQMGLIVSAIALWSPMGVSSAILHMVNHTVFKGLLFLSVGGLALVNGTRDIRKISIFNSHILLTISFLIGLAALMGLPPMNGFYSYTFMLGAFKGNWILYALLLVVQVLTVGAVFRIIFNSSKIRVEKELPVSMLMPMIILAGLTIFIGSTSTIWMRNIVLPAGSSLVVQETVPLITYVELYSIITMDGLAVLCTIPFGLLLAKKVKSTSFEKFKFYFARIPLTDSVRTMIVFLLIVLVLLSIV